MSTYAIEHSIQVNLESLEGVGVADRDIELDYMLRTLALSIDHDERKEWWLWR